MHFGQTISNENYLLYIIWEVKLRFFEFFDEFDEFMMKLEVFFFFFLRFMCQGLLK